MATPLGPSDTIGAPKATPDGRQSGWATKEDWVQHRTLIGLLYSKQTLAEVLSHMETRHRFRATGKMYKTRVKQWGLDKRHKEVEMKAIVRKHKHLQGQGKSITFRVRGQLIDFKNVVRYWERKGPQIEDVIAQRSDSKTPEAIYCCVSPSSLSGTLEPMAILERILVSIRDYFSGSFEAGTWLATNPRKGCETMKDQVDAKILLGDMIDKLWIACKLLANNRRQEAGQTLVSATSEIKRMLLAEHPETLTYVFRITAYLLQYRRHEIAFAILRQLAALAKILVGEGHPLHRICQWLAAVHPYQLEHIIPKCSASTGDNFESLVGPVNASTLFSRLAYVAVIDVGQDASDSTFVLNDVLRNCEAAFSPLDTRMYEVHLSFARHYLRNRDYVKALELGRKVVASGSALIPLLTLDVHFILTVLRL